jgi:lipopolysaccharide transport system permease protein
MSEAEMPGPRSLVLRDFIWTLIRTDFKVRYHGAVGGFIWALAKPIVIFAVLFTVFRFLFPERGYGDNLFLGILLWSFFTEASSSGLESLYTKGFLITKASFPRWIVVFTSMVNALLTLSVYAAAMIVVVALTRGLPAPSHVLLFVLYLFLYAVMVFGFALGASVLFPKYRDLNQIWDVTLQAGFFVAPIIYPIDKLPERYHVFLYIWPVTPIVQFSRAVLLGGPTPTLKAHMMLFGMAGAILLIGILMFRRFVARAVESL